jgi:universal stress protein family protein
LGTSIDTIGTDVSSGCLTGKESVAMSIFPAKILLATDGSEGAELAALRKVDLVRRTGSELHLVHVGQAPAFLMSDPGTRGYNPMLYRTRG